MRTIIPKNAKLIPKNAKRVFKGQIFDVYHWQQKMFDGSYATFEMLKRPDTIKVIAIKDNKVVILDQEQPGHDEFIDLPGGRHDNENESELGAAKRETLEETGMRFNNWRLVNVQQPYAKMDWFVYIFIATGFDKQQGQKLDNGEKIEVRLVNFDELKQLLENPKARHLPKELLESCQSIEDLANLPEYKN
jgi:ADP-ribose pyrophosphatase